MRQVDAQQGSMLDDFILFGPLLLHTPQAQAEHEGLPRALLPCGSEFVGQSVVSSEVLCSTGPYAAE